MTTLYLMRHGATQHNGETVFNGPKRELSEEGRVQAGKAADFFRANGVKLGIVISSPYMRARQTSEIVSTSLEAPLAFDERLVEWQVGPHFDKPLAQFYAETNYDEDPPPPTLPPEVEPLTNLAMRMTQTLEEFANRYREQNVLVVSHREPIAVALLSFEEKPLYEVHHPELNTGDIWKVEFDQDGLVASVARVFGSR